MQDSSNKKMSSSEQGYRKSEIGKPAHSLTIHIYKISFGLPKIKMIEVRRKMHFSIVRIVPMHETEC